MKARQFCKSGIRHRKDSRRHSELLAQATVEFRNRSGALPFGPRQPTSLARCRMSFDVS